MFFRYEIGRCLGGKSDVTSRRARAPYQIWLKTKFQTEIGCNGKRLTIFVNTVFATPLTSI
jgi:hypothetical protein